MSILITGSIAYDHLLEYKGQFSDVLIADKLQNLSVCFLAQEKKICFGGCAGNIAYNLKLLKADFIVYGRAGKDFNEYEKHFKKLKIDTKYIQKITNKYTATAYITTDINGHQITTFAPGAMFDGSKISLTSISDKIDLAIIAPEDSHFMNQIYRECKKHKIPYVFDPGQQLPIFDKKNLEEIINNAFITIVNDYEFELLAKILKIDKNYFLKNKKTLIITKGEKGSELITAGKEQKIKIFKPKKIVDPTGCGDAYRAGLLYGIANNWDLKKSCELGAKLATKVIEKRGTQEHKN